MKRLDQVLFIENAFEFIKSLMIDVNRNFINIYIYLYNKYFAYK